MTSVPDSVIEQVNYFLNTEWAPAIQEMIPDLPSYWGDQCQLLACHIVGYLEVFLGIPAEILVGEVSINGTLEYDTNLTVLKKEYFDEEFLTDAQALHVWVSIGSDVIIDAAIADRLSRYYQIPRNSMPTVMVGRAADFLSSGFNFSAAYQPMIYGRDFLAKTFSPGPEEIKKLYSDLYQSNKN